MAIILTTDRLILRHFVPDDDELIWRLLNTPKWLQYIGNRNIGSLAMARSYIEDVLISSYRINGFGFYLATLRHAPKVGIGLCGLAKRSFMEDVDLGFALLPEFEGQGYAFEMAEAMLRYVQSEWQLRRVAAITSLDNERSIRLLKKIGFEDAGTVLYPPDDEELLLFIAKV